MQLNLVIEALRTRCPAFGGRVAGAAEFKVLPEGAALTVPCAFVIPLDDNPSEAQSQNSVRQLLDDAFAVVVAVPNAADERGQAGTHSVDSIRRELWAGLLGWAPAECYGGIVYSGGALMHLDRSRLWYQFDFSAPMEIGPEDGYQKSELENLGPFDGGSVRVDAIDPSDPNVVQTPAPDGRIEAGFDFILPSS